MKSKLYVNLTKIRDLGILATMTLFFVGTATAQTINIPPDKLESPGEGLVTVVYPNLGGVEPKVAKQVKSVQETLVKQLNEGKAKKKDMGNAYGTTGMVYHTYSMFESAVQCYKNAAFLMPEDFRWRHLMGLIWLEQNDPAAAITEFKKSAVLNPAYVPSFVKGGNAALELNLIDQARLAYEIALQKKPNDPAALYGLGQVEYQEKNYKKAAEHFEKVLKLVPEANRVHYTLALAYRGLNELERAKVEMSKQGSVGVTISDPLLDELANLRRGNILKLQQAKLALDAGRPAEAAALYKDVLAEDPENMTALVNIGSAYSMLKKYEDASAAFEKALAIDPKNLNARYNLGFMHAIENRPFQAIASFKAVLKARPDDLEARYMLAKELTKAELFDESIAEYREVVDGNPQNENALMSLISLLDARGLHKEVLERLDHAYSLFPTRALTVASYAFALAASPDKSLRNGERALELSQKLYAVTGRTEHGFIVVLALSELGRCENALELGRKFIQKAEQDKQMALAAQLTAEVEKLTKPGGCGKPQN